MYCVSIKLKRNSSFHDNNVLGTTPKRATNHDYLSVSIPNYLNWHRNAKEFQTRLVEPLVYLEEPYHPAHKT